MSAESLIARAVSQTFARIFISATAYKVGLADSSPVAYTLA